MVITPNILPNILVFNIRYKQKGNLMIKLAAITFLLPLLPVTLEGLKEPNSESKACLKVFIT